MIVCPGQRRPDDMGVKTYLQFLFSRRWQAAKPRTALPTYSIPCTAVAICLFGLATSVHFRMLNSGCIISIGALFQPSYLHRGHPAEYIKEDSLASITNLILLAWDSVPDRSYEGSILV